MGCDASKDRAVPHVVIPAYNEAASIGSVVAGIRERIPDARIIVVNDCSRDETADLARRAGEVVVDLPFNLGYGAALQTGLMWAWRAGAQLVATMDADGQHDARDLATLLGPVARGEADIVLGSRYLPDSRCYSVPILRRAGSLFFAKLLTGILGMRISDPTTGFQCVGRKALELYATLPDFPEKTPDADLILYAHVAGCRVVEVPVTMHEDESGDSMHGLLKSLFYVPKMCVSILGILAMSVTRKRHATLHAGIPA